MYKPGSFTVFLDAFVMTNTKNLSPVSAAKRSLKAARSALTAFYETQEDTSSKNVKSRLPVMSSFVSPLFAPLACWGAYALFTAIDSDFRFWGATALVSGVAGFFFFRWTAQFEIRAFQNRYAAINRAYDVDFARKEKPFLYAIDRAEAELSRQRMIAMGKPLEDVPAALPEAQAKTLIDRDQWR